MLKITVACVGTLKEKYWQEALAEYVKRLAPFCRLQLVAIPEEKMPADPAPAEKERVLDKETARLLAVLPEHAYVIVLDVAGKQLSSPELADKLQQLTVQGCSHVVFVIGGAFGFTDALRQKAQPLQCGFRHVFPECTAEANPRERPALQPGRRQQAFQSQRKRGLDLEDFLHVGPGKLHAAGQRQAPASGPAFDGSEQAGGQR